MSQIYQYQPPVYRHAGNNATLGILTSGLIAVCGALMVAIGIGPGLIITLILLALIGYAALCWYRPAAALCLIIAISAFSETEKRNYDPLSQLEYSLQSSLSTTLHGPPVMPLEIMMLALVAIWAFKRWHGDIPGKPLFGAFGPLVYVLLGFIGFGYAWGIFLRPGGDSIIGLWEARALIQLLVVFMLAGQLLTTEKHWRNFFQTLLVMVGLVALKVIFRVIVYIGNFELIDEESFAHNNVLLFNFFFIFGLAYLFFKPKTGQGWGRLWWSIYGLMLPFVITADLLQQRRSGFGSLALGLVVLLVLGARLKPAQLLTAGLLIIVVIAAYFAAFWNTTNPLLAQPIRSIRSIIEPNVRDYLSNQYREIESFNINETVATSPILGIGFGQEFLFIKPMPNISGWPFWKYTPHNEVIWLWLKIGLGGFITFWLVMAASFLRGTKLFWRTSGSMLQPLIMAAICANVMQVFFAWIDQGYSQMRSMVWLAPMLALVCYWQLEAKRKQKRHG